MCTVDVISKKSCVRVSVQSLFFARIFSESIIISLAVFVVCSTSTAIPPYLYTIVVPRGMESIMQKPLILILEIPVGIYEEY